MMQEISLCDIFGIMTKTAYEAVLMGERNVRMEISDFVMRTFVFIPEISGIHRFRYVRACRLSSSLESSHAIVSRRLAARERGA
mgnify:FL=1